MLSGEVKFAEFADETPPPKKTSKVDNTKYLKQLIAAGEFKVDTHAYT